MQAPSALETTQILIRLPLAGSRALKLIGGGMAAASSPLVFASLGLRLYSASVADESCLKIALRLLSRLVGRVYCNLQQVVAGELRATTSNGGRIG